MQADLRPRRASTDVDPANRRDVFGGLDILVNNVGLGRGAGIVGHDATPEWTEALDQTLFPAIRASRLAVPLMRAPRRRRRS